VSSSDYLTIEEAAQKLGRPPSWVKGQICEGKLGATLAGRNWLISPEALDKLLSSDPPPPQPNNTVHDSLPQRTARKSRGVANHQSTIKQAEVMAVWQKLELGERPETIQAMYHALLSRSPYIKQHLRSVGAVDALRKLAQIPDRIRALEKAAEIREHERQLVRDRFLSELGLRDRFVEDFLGTDTYLESALARHTSFDEADLQGLRRTYEQEKARFVHAWVQDETGTRLDNVTILPAK
jgi:excisionase family DNA binding protein